MLMRTVLLVVALMSASALSLSILRTYCGGNEVSIKNLEVPLQLSTVATVAVASSVSDDRSLRISSPDDGSIRISSPADGSSRSSSSSDVIGSHAIELTIDEKHLGTSASIIYRTVDQSSMLFLHGDARIFASTPIIDLLLLVLLHHNAIQRSSYVTIRWGDVSTCSKHPVSLSTLFSDRGDDEVAPSIDSNEVVEYCIDDSVRFIERSLRSSSNDEPVDWLSDDSTCLCSLPRSIIHRYNLLHQGIGVMLLGGRRRDRLYLHKRSSSKRVFPSMLDMFIGGVTLSGEKPIQTLFRELREECGIDVLSVSTSVDNDDNAFYGDTRRGHRAHDSSDEGDSSQLDSGSGIGGSSKLAWRSAVEVAFRRYKKSLDLSSATTSTTTTVDAQADRHVGSALRLVGQTIIATKLNHCLVHVYFLQLSDEQSSQIAFADGEIEWGRWVTFSDLDALLADEEGVEQFVPDGMQVS